MALLDLFEHLNSLVELFEHVGGATIEGNFHEHQQRRIQIMRVQNSGISFDIALTLEATNPFQTRCGTQANSFGQLNVRNPAILLQFIQNVAVNPVQIL
ncbi:hypothetical protein D3C79_829310 [compost metagenome]